MLEPTVLSATPNPSSEKILSSNEDRSVNFVAPNEDGGYFEARYVRRQADYVVVYLSSHTGCAKACRFCHLTATRQIMMTPADTSEFRRQAGEVLNHYDRVIADDGVAERVHYNWMARGEPLDNPTILSSFPSLTAHLGELARARSLEPIFNLSTILPRSLGDRDLTETLTNSAGEVVVYYSLYSLDPGFRRRWLPTALPAEEALGRLSEYQEATGARLVLHWAYIAGENDSLEQTHAIAEAIRRHKISAKFNLVRYNPFSDKHGRESEASRRDENFALIASALGNPESREIPRVGFDVKASCGMFVTADA